MSEKKQKIEGIQQLADYLASHADNDWQKVNLKVNFLGEGVVEANGYYLNDREEKNSLTLDYTISEISEKIKASLKEKHQKQLKGMEITLKKDGKFNLELLYKNNN